MVGQRVWVWDTGREGNLGDKLRPWWKGPLVLVARKSNSVWVVKDDAGHEWVIHSDMIRPVYEG